MSENRETNSPDDEFEPQDEIERRFLVRDTSIVKGCSWELITQAYVFAMSGRAIRVRLTERHGVDGSLESVKAMGTFKGPRVGVKRREYEVEMDVELGRYYVENSENVIEKRRYHFVSDQTWDIDEFLGVNKGLWIAEIEGTDADEILRIPRPGWASKEVTSDADYNNDNLAIRPFETWEDETPDADDDPDL